MDIRILSSSEMQFDVEPFDAAIILDALDHYTGVLQSNIELLGEDTVAADMRARAQSLKEQLRAACADYIIHQTS